MAKRVVVVGGGFGGLLTAQGLARVDVEVTLVDRENHHLFQPLLYQVATAGLAPGSIAVPIRSALGRQKNARVLLGEVVGADLERRAVVLEDGTRIDYDYLVVAAGAKTNYFGNDQWAEHAHGLKDLRDAIRVRERVLLAFEAAEREQDADARRHLLSFVVIGGGPTGVEMAGAISELGRQVLASDFRRVRPEDVNVTLVEMGDRVLSPLDPKLSRRAQEQLEGLGVALRLGARVTDVNAEGVAIGDDIIEAATVVWASGVRPVSLAAKLGVELTQGGRIAVDQCCAVPDHREVFAIGDIAAFVPEGEERALPGLAPVAMQQGRHIARLIEDELAARRRRPFLFVDKGTMATIGRSRAVVDAGWMKLSGFVAWLAWGLIHVLYLISYRNRFIVMFNWAWSYLTFKRGARLIVGRHRLRKR